MKTATCVSCGNSISGSNPSARPGVCSGCIARESATTVSATSRAIEEAMRAMDAKEADRSKKGLSRPAPKPVSASGYALGAGAKRNLASPIVESGGSWKSYQVTRKQGYIAASVAAGLLLLIYTYSAVAPTAWESEQRETVLQTRAEGDRLVRQGKKLEAFQAYGKIVLMTANRPLHSSEIKQAVVAARQARIELFPDIKASEGKARIARYVR